MAYRNNINECTINPIENEMASGNQASITWFDAKLIDTDLGVLGKTVKRSLKHLPVYGNLVSTVCEVCVFRYFSEIAPGPGG